MIYQTSKMKTTTTISAEAIENAISFTREQYEAKQQAQELAPFDAFLSDIAQATAENGGTLEDAVFMADDAFGKL